MAKREQDLMQKLEPAGAEERESPPGIVIHEPVVVEPRPAIFAFIWGGKVRPAPALPYGFGRRSA
ncbi:MAG: hypothetical protein FIB01_10375 [Gemmatimonadetes bacterium]|nr:hypothetical protein [Gemmatimonadota bacterium]